MDPCPPFTHGVSTSSQNTKGDGTAPIAVPISRISGLVAGDVLIVPDLVGPDPRPLGLGDRPAREARDAYHNNCICIIYCVP